MRRGFTLLELMIAVFILAMAVAVLLGTQSTSMRMMGYANNTSVVTMLTRSKMQDIEYEVAQTVKKEGIKEKYEETIDGDFRDQGYGDIKWSALIQSIELSDDASTDFVDSVTKQIYGEGDEGGTLSGNTTITQFLPMMVGFMPQIINQLGQRIRRITLTTTWEYLGVEQKDCVVFEDTQRYIDQAKSLGIDTVGIEKINDNTKLSSNYIIQVR